MINPWFLMLGAISMLLTATLRADQLPLLVVEDFSEDMSRWKTSDPAGTEQTWQIIDARLPENTVRALRSGGGSQFKPPHRSPLNIAILKEPVCSDFELTVNMQNTNYNAGDHRDLCIFWGYQDPAHFYYVHLGAKADSTASCQIFIVNGAERKVITVKPSRGTPWSKDWHFVKVTRGINSGDMEVFFDDMQEPLMTANNREFKWGRVGLGTFDDHGNFSQFRLYGQEVFPIPSEARLPGE